MVSILLRNRFARSGLPLAIALATAPLVHARENAGVTLAARGDVEAFDLRDEVSRALSRRSDVFNVDSILTGANSQAQIRMVDDAVISVRSESELVIAEYHYDEATGEGRATMELVSGGLRALTGSINPESDDSDYEVRTSVGSIGIRGTHFEVLQSDGDLLLGAWDGEIELNLSVGDGGGQIILGGNQEYSFASVNDQGEVTFFLEPPPEFDSGHTTDDGETEETEEDDSEEEPTEEQEEESDVEEESEEGDDESDEDEVTDEAPDDDEVDADDEASDDETDVETGDEDSSGEEPATDVEDDPVTGQDAEAAGEPPVSPGSQVPGTAALAAAQQSASGSDTPVTPAPVPEVIDPINLPTPPNVIAQRTGTARYNNLVSAELEGHRTDFAVTISFRVNFTLGTVDDGKVNLSADDGVSWLGLFDGGVTGNELQIGPQIGVNEFNSALYRDADDVAHEARGQLSGTFFGGNAEQVRGNFSFEHLNDSSVWVSGDYSLGEAD